MQTPVKILKGKTITKFLDWEWGFIPHETLKPAKQQTEGDNSGVNFENMRLTKFPKHTSHRRKEKKKVIFRTRMVKSGSDDFGDWILKLLTFQSSVSYLRDQSHQPNHCRYWQCSCLVSAPFWGRGDLTHEVNANTSSSNGDLYISPPTS